MEGKTESGGKIQLFDPSEYRLESKPKQSYRIYNQDTPQRVIDTYYEMHTKQSLEFAREKLKFWGKLNHSEMPIMDVLESLNQLVDTSDPDVDLPNSFHAFQTAEGIRKMHPELDWFHLTGLIHDLGKIMAVWGEPQWCVVGDTFPVGCQPSEKIVFGHDSFRDNPDIQDAKLNTRLGIYDENCGLEKVTMSWGHDEYLYRVLRSNTCHLPEEAFYIIRFHSFFPWHTSDAYNYLCENKDMEMMKWVREFNQFDLYTKSSDVPDVDALIPYYQSLIDKYVPGKLKW